MSVLQAEDIADPIAGIAYCNKHIRRCEQLAEQAKLDGDLALVSKFEGHCFNWTELLEKYLHQAFQQGKMSEDVTTIFDKKKGRFNG